MSMLYRSVWVTREDEARALPPGSFVHPDCRRGGILTYLVPIEAEEDTWLAGPDKPLVNGQRIDKTAHRWCTPWEEAR